MNPITKLEIDTKIGKILKAYRTKHSLTQEKMAERLGISVKYISRIENGTGGIKLETLVNYMNILGIVPNVLFKDLVHDDSVQSHIRLTDKISTLSEDKIDFLLSFIDLLQHYD